ncbi:hypothetical protein [Georgenia sp.]
MNIELAQIEMLVGSAVLLSGVLFIADSWGRRRDTSDQMWALALMSAVGASLAGVFWSLHPSAWTLAFHHAGLVTAVGSVWSGARAAEGRNPFTWLAVAPAVPVALVVVLLGPDAALHTSLPVLLVAVAAAAVGTGVLVSRGSLRTRRGGPVLGTAMFLLGAYSLFRLALYLTVGPTSEVYHALAGSTVTALLTGLAFIAAAFGMVMLRSAHTPDAGTERFDWLTGARLPHAFAVRARQVLAESDRMGHTVTLARIEPEDVAAIDVAFGRGAGAVALATAGEITAMLEPAGAVLGLTTTHGFEVLLPAMQASDGHRWATTLRKALIDTPLDVTGGHLRLTISVGLASSSVHGYSLAALRAGAEAAVGEALSAGGNRVRVAELPVAAPA